MDIRVSAKKTGRPARPRATAPLNRAKHNVATDKDLAFLQDESSEQAALKNISQPRSKLKLWHVLAPVAVVALAAVLWFGLQAGQESAVGADTASEEFVADLPEAPVVQPELFSAASFYEVELMDGVKFYAQVATAEFNHYRLTSVFYASSTASQPGLETEQVVETSEEASEQERLTLFEYTTAANEVVEEVLLPREQVRSLTVLKETSPIYRALEVHLEKGAH